MAIEKTVSLDVRVKDDELNKLNNKLDDTSAGFDNVGESISGVSGSLDELPGSTGAAVKGVKSLGMAFKALLANPIGLVITAVVGAITLLFKAFQRTAVGGDKLSKVFEGIGAAMGPVLDALGKFAEGLISFLSGDFTKGIEEMGNAFNGLGKEIETAYKNAGKLVDLRRELRQMNRDLIEGEAELTKQMDKQRSVLDDVDKSTQTRIQANEKLNDLNKELLASRQKYIDKQLEEAKIQLEQAGKDDEALEDAKDRISELTAARTLAEAERFRIEKEYVVKRNELAKLQQEENKVRNETTLGEAATQAEAIVTTDEDLQGKLVQNATDTTEWKKEQDKLSFAQEKMTTEQRIDTARAGFQIIGNLAELFAGKSEASRRKVFKVQKAASIASTTIDTYKSAVAAFSGMVSTIPGPVGIALGGVAAAGAITAGLLQVKRIASQKFQGGGAGGSANFPKTNLSGAGGQTAPQFNTVGTGGTNQIAEALGNQPPQKAYVVSGEVTTQQALDRQTQETAVL